ncbi:aspartate aminotransferase [bacterium]|nr:MAG: aspartate aminotransferase [bacterium]
MKELLSKRAHSLEPSVTLSLNTKANDLKARGEDVVGLTAGEPDFPTPESIKDAAIKAIHDNKTKYTPGAGIRELREVVARAYSNILSVDYSAGEVVVSHGAKHSIFNALFTLIDPGDEVMLLSPYWTSYPEMVKIVGGVPRIVELTKETGFKLTPEILLGEIDKRRPKALLFNSPNNPTGIVYSRDEMEALSKIILDAGIALISDEIYEFLTYDGYEHVSPIRVVPELKGQSVVISGVSKSYSMTGWRLGFALAEENVAYRMAAYQAHATGCPNSISQWAAVEAVEHGGEAREMMRKEFERRKELFGRRLKAIREISYPEPHGAFYYFIDVSSLYERCGVSGSSEFCDKLLEKNGLVVVPGSAFGCDNMVRFSFAASEDEINEALDRFESFVASCTR